MKRFICFFFCLFFFLSLPVAFKRFTCGFKLAKMETTLSFRSDWERPSSLSSGALDALFKQPFFYLDKGAQCYVFESQDHEYVIKFFRYEKPHFFRKKGNGSAFEKAEKLFSACLLAYDQAQEETALVYLHLNLTKDTLPILQLKGPIGQTFSLPLDRYRFAIQKRVDSFRDSFLQAIGSKDRVEFERLIDSFVFLLESRIQKGICNSDPTLSRNFGFLRGKAVEIDFGNYFFHPGLTVYEMDRYTDRLRKWLEKSYPEGIVYLDERVKACEKKPI